VECLGETIPIRLFLGGFDLTPTFRDVNKKYSTRYYLSLVLIDEGTWIIIYTNNVYPTRVSILPRLCTIHSLWVKLCSHEAFPPSFLPHISLMPGKCPLFSIALNFMECENAWGYFSVFSVFGWIAVLGNITSNSENSVGWPNEDPHANWAFKFSFYVLYTVHCWCSRQNFAFSSGRTFSYCF
jgi:vacuolar protein sorting-associated protein VPS26